MDSSNTDYRLTTERLRLRPLVATDFDALAAILADPEVAKGLVGDVSTREGLRVTAAEWIDDETYWHDNGYGMWAVEDSGKLTGHPGRLIGVAGANDAPPGTGVGPEVYYFFSPDVWGTGAGIEAMTEICRYLFDEIGVAALEALIYAELNPGSVGLARKLGMEPVGRMPIVGHDLDPIRAEATQRFDAWRIRHAPAGALLEVIDHAVFRSGQLLAEGIGTREAVLESLVTAAREAGSEQGVWHPDQEKRIEERLSAGFAAPGFGHYRVTKAAWASR